MRKLSWLLLLLNFLLSFTVMANQASDHLSHLLANFHSMRANFSQTVAVKTGPAKNSTGLMALQRPGKFRWQVTSPNHQLIIADGKYLWLYDIDLEQATKKKLAADNNSPASLLSGSPQLLQQRFIVTEVSSSNPQIFRLQPRSNQDMIKNIELVFANKKLQRLAVIDHLGQKNIFTFTAVKINPQLAANLFRFQAPPGVDIIQN